MNDGKSTVEMLVDIIKGDDANHHHIEEYVTYFPVENYICPGENSRIGLGDHIYINGKEFCVKDKAVKNNVKIFLLKNPLG
ncbi:MAG: hypothetical protein Q8L64_00725 [bacterium]|nr:hypothetical protein [bacterium]